MGELERSGAFFMIDLSPQPQDKSSATTELHPRHDPIGAAPVETVRNRGWWPFTHAEAEAGVELLSRWAGPAALALALGIIGWWLLG